MQAFGWVMRAIALLLLLVALLAGLVGLSALSRDEPSMLQLSVAAARVWFVLLAVLVAVLALWLTWRLLRALVLAVFGSAVLGDSTGTRLIGLGVAALVFPQALSALLNAPLVIAIELLRNLPERMRAVVSTLYAGDGDSMPLEAVLLRLVDLLQLLGAELARTLDLALRQLPLVDTALAFALWVLVAQALRAVPAAQEGAGGKQPRLLRAWLRLDAAQRYLFGLGVVFAIGGFMSIASIVAIPWLKEDKVPAGLTQESLQKALDGLATPAADLNKWMPQDFAKELAPFEPLEQALQASSAKDIDPLLADFSRQALTRTKSVRASALLRAAELREDLLPQQARIVESALRAFQTESAQPMSAQERLFFFRAIQRQVANMLAQQGQRLAECRRAIEATDRDADFVARDAANAIEQAAGEAGSRQWDRVFATGRLDSAYESACTRPPVARSEFVPPEAGSGWGPFGRIANWLLRTKSFALALITGMLGFGLLGAAIAAYVRGGAAAGTGEIGLVVVRGLSAAVVLFLAVKGGLAVLAVGEQDPNAYVLFFLCLVGAVYSDDVWRWARVKLLGRLGEEKGTADGKAKGKAPAPPDA